jgi:hypothetical protein
MSVDLVYTPTTGRGSTAAECFDVSCIELPSGKHYDNTNGVLTSACTYANTRIAMSELNTSGRFGVSFPSTMPIGKYEVAVIVRELPATAAATDDVVRVLEIQKNDRSNIIFLDSPVFSK